MRRVHFRHSTRDLAAENWSNVPIEVSRVDFPSARALGEFRSGSVHQVAINEPRDHERLFGGLFPRARVLAILRPPKSLGRRYSGLIRRQRRAVNAKGVNMLSPPNPAFQRVHFSPAGIDAEKKAPNFRVPNPRLPDNRRTYGVNHALRDF